MAVVVVLERCSIEFPLFPLYKDEKKIVINHRTEEWWISIRRYWNKSFINLQVSRDILYVNQHWVLSHTQIVTIHQILHQHFIKCFNKSVEIIYYNLQLSDVHVCQHLSGHSTFCRWNFDTNFSESFVNEFSDGALSLLLSLNLWNEKVCEIETFIKIIFFYFTSICMWAMSFACAKAIRASICNFAWCVKKLLSLGFVEIPKDKVVGLSAENKTLNLRDLLLHLSSNLFHFHP